MSYFDCHKLIKTEGVTLPIWNAANMQHNFKIEKPSNPSDVDEVIYLLKARIILKLRIELMTTKIRDCNNSRYFNYEPSVADLEEQLQEIKDKLNSDDVQRKLREDEELRTKLNEKEYSHLIEDPKFAFIKKRKNMGNTSRSKKPGFFSKMLSKLAGTEGGSRSTRRRKQKARKSRRRKN